ncbi:hypothetical protein ABZT45_34655 [Streptomyces sp. NPDC005356]|uniref:hypothetical protein n=1 Tax=Streptomyces sp. NPDC005356 TaxID=3157167 RepID=UPI0033A8FDAC
MSVVQPEQAPRAPLSLETETLAVLRFPQINLPMWYRVLAIADSRGELPMRLRRLSRFLSQQELDPATGHVIGQWDTGQVDGGMDLAHGYALTEGFGDDRFWDDLKLAYRHGYVEQAVKPAPGRRAVYALCLRIDAIPNELPDDLMRQLKVWDLREVEVRHEDARYGRLTASTPVPLAEAESVEVDEQTAVELAVAPRWEHPADSSSAVAAEAIRTSAKALESEDGPKDLRCWAVADRDRAEALNERLMSNGKTSPSYAKGFQLSGLFPAGSSGLSWSNDMGQTKTTPTAAPGEKPSFLFGDDPTAVANRVLRRAWHAWRTQLGHGKVILPNGSWDELGRWHSGSAWSDLQRTVQIALRRSTESELVEMLSSSVAGVDDVGRLAAWRLWRLINSRKNSHGYASRRTTGVASWDGVETTVVKPARVLAQRPAEPDLNSRAAELQEQNRRREAARLAAEAELAAEAKRAELAGRWDLERWAVPSTEQEQPRRWSARQPEDVHQAEMEQRRYIDRPVVRSESEETYRAALARARAEKRARRRS